MLGRFAPAIALLLAFKLRIVRRSVRFAIKVVAGKRPRSFALPVAGLEEPKAQFIIFTLRRSASTRAERHIARDWLVAWQLTQVAANRLLYELDEVQENLKFWKRRTQMDGHFWFLLLQQGPSAFYQQVRQMFVRERKQAQALQLSEADMMEKRVLLFQLLSTMLCEALARVQRAAEILYLQDQPNGDSNVADSVSSLEQDDEDIFDQVERAVETAMSQVEQAFSNLRERARDVLEVPANRPMAAAQERQLLAQATTKVLRLKSLKSMGNSTRRRISRQPTLVQIEEEGEDDLDDEDEDEEEMGGSSPVSGAARKLVDTNAEEDEEDEDFMAAGTSGPVLYVSTLDAIKKGRRAIGIRSTVLAPLPTNAPAQTAWEQAEAATKKLRGQRIFTLPSWLRMPSEQQQNWIRNSLLGLGAAYVTIFLYRHSRLSGSRDLENWLITAGDSMESAVNDNMVKPLRKVSGGLFQRYKRRSDEREYNADRESLNRMIADFKEDVERNSRSASGLPFVLPWVTGGGDSGSGRAEGAAAASPPTDQQLDAAAGGQGEGGAAEAGGGGSGSGGGGEGLEEVRPSDDESPHSSSPPCVAVEPVGRRSSRRAVVDHEGIEIVMRAYEEAIKNPIKGVATGQLPRTLLIQLQKIKTDGANMMIEMDQILKSNELTVSLIAAVPAFLIAGSTVYTGIKWMSPRPPDPRFEALPCRMAMLSMAQALERLCRDEEEGTNMDEDVGWFFYCLAVGHEEASALFRRQRGLLLGRNAWHEWPALRGDLIDLATPAPPNARLRTTKRMMRAYSVFKY